MDMIGFVIDTIQTLLDGAALRQTEKCLDRLVKEGLVEKNSQQYYYLKNEFLRK